MGAVVRDWDWFDWTMAVVCTVAVGLGGWAIFLLIWLPMHNWYCPSGTIAVQTGEIWTGKFFVPQMTCEEVSEN